MARDRTSGDGWEPNFSWITAHLALGGHIPVERVEDLARRFAIRAVIDLRLEARDDERVLREHGLTFLHLPTEDLCAVAQASLDHGVTFANRHLDRGERVLIHCEHGIGRSATLALCVLVSRGLAPLEALERAKARRPLVSPSPAQYEAWVQWLVARPSPAGVSRAIPSFDAFKAIAYRHLEDRS